jgi:hypothetical protein
MKVSKGKNLLIKNNIKRDVDATSRNAQELKSFVHGAIAQEHTSFRPEGKFSSIIWLKVRPTGTPKDPEHRVIEFFMKQGFKRRGNIEGSLWVYD